MDGAAVGVEDATTPYGYTWNTVGASNGSHALTAVARDTAGNLRTSAAVTVQVSNQPPPAGSGLVAAYGFDEGTGTVASDASGHGNTGTIAGAIWTPGRFGQSLEFDGVADWVTVAASGELNFTSAMTVEAWVYATEAGGWRSVVFKEAPGEIRDHNYGLYSGFAAQGPGGHVLLDGFADNVKAHAPAVIVLNRWTHVATTYDGSVLRAYVDGVERAAVAAAGPINVTGGVLRIGGNSIYGDFFKGQIDEVRLYSRALSPAEIATDMSTPIGTPPAGDTTPPTTAITAPAAGSQVSGSVAVSATATDNVAVAGVTFQVDGVAAGAEDTTAPYAYTWNSVSASNGSHALTAVARDTAGNLRTSAVVTVQVSNTTTPPPPVGSGLVAAYGFDEGTGTVTADASGQGNPGTITGAIWKPGRFGQSLEFDGSTDWVTVAANNAVNFTATMTVEAWIYPTEAAGWRSVVFKEAPGEIRDHNYGLYSAFGAEGPGGHVLLEGFADNIKAHASAAIVLNRWTHVATTYDGSVLRAYVDGVERSAVAATGPINMSPGVLRLGGNSMYGDFFKGQIDEVRLYNRALSPAEIGADMSTPIDSGLVAAYQIRRGRRHHYSGCVRPWQWRRDHRCGVEGRQVRPVARVRWRQRPGDDRGERQRERDNRHHRRGVGLSDRGSQLAHHPVQGGARAGQRAQLCTLFRLRGGRARRACAGGQPGERARSGGTGAESMDARGHDLRWQPDSLIRRRRRTGVGRRRGSDQPLQRRVAHRRQRDLGGLLHGPYRRGAPLQSRPVRG